MKQTKQVEQIQTDKDEQIYEILEEFYRFENFESAKKKIDGLLSQAQQEAVEEEREKILRIVKSLPLCNICGSGKAIEKALTTKERNK